jgi:hypothetical protein
MARNDDLPQRYIAPLLRPMDGILRGECGLFRPIAGVSRTERLVGVAQQVGSSTTDVTWQVFDRLREQRGILEELAALHNRAAKRSPRVPLQCEPRVVTAHRRSSAQNNMSSRRTGRLVSGGLALRATTSMV